LLLGCKSLTYDYMARSAPSDASNSRYEP